MNVLCNTHCSAEGVGILYNVWRVPCSISQRVHDPSISRPGPHTHHRVDTHYETIKSYEHRGNLQKWTGKKRLHYGIVRHILGY